MPWSNRTCWSITRVSTNLWPMFAHTKRQVPLSSHDCVMEVYQRIFHLKKGWLFNVVICMPMHHHNKGVMEFFSKFKERGWLAYLVCSLFSSVGCDKDFALCSFISVTGYSWGSKISCLKRVKDTNSFSSTLILRSGESSGTHAPLCPVGFCSRASVAYR